MTLKPIEPADYIDSGPAGLSPVVLEELEGMLEEAGLDTSVPATRQWCSWVPMAGVRYYTYEDHPSPVHGAVRPGRVKEASNR